MSFFERMNRKQKRKFKKLGNEEKSQIISHEINQKIKDERNKIVAISFADGYLYASKLLYDHFFERWKKAKYNEKHKIAKEMMEQIEKDNERYLERHGLNKESEENNEENNNEENNSVEVK